MKGSITRETLIKMAVRIALVIVGSTGISYLHIMSTLESQTQRQLEKYITERGQRESSIFLLTKDNHAVLEQDLRRRLDEVNNRQSDFERLLVRSPDGVIRNQPKGFDRSRQPSVFIDKNLAITPEIRDRVLTFYDLVMTYGPSWRSRFQNTYINAPENFMVMYWPEVPWAENATADQGIPKEEYFWIADKKHNPARETVCTALYYDQVARDWTVSCETPIDIKGKQIATVGHDIVLNELLDRTLKDRLQGTYNMIFRGDGRLIAHPEKGDEIKQKLGKFNILNSGDPHLVRIFQLVKDLKPGQVVVENFQDNEYLAIAKLDIPNWYFVTVFPKSILAGLAFDNARFILILGWLSLLIEVTILCFVLRQQVASPLNNLIVATDQITAGDFNIQLDTTRLDELGRLAHSFNVMAGEVYAREARLKQAQEALQATDKLKDEFLANTSHELRTPLNGIIGIAESLIDGVTGKLPASTISNLAMIASSGRRLATLVNDILDFSKLRHQTIELQLKPVAVREIVEVVLTLNRLLIDKKHLQLVNAIPDDLPLVSADENRLQQILYNLIGNAIKFTDSGSVQVSAQLISSEVDGEESQIAITISDTGIGIPSEKVDRIFESFEQADGSTARIYGGTGLGLAISKKLVELHGGEIRVESVIDQGSRFTFTLPVSQISEVSSQGVLVSSRYQFSPVHDSLVSEAEAIAPNAAPDAIAKNRQPATNNPEWSILIVDDEPVNRQVLVNHLSLYNYEITEAASGIEALAILEGGLKPDLILLDVMMPRMTGYDVTRQIRQTWQASELPIVLLTARNQVSDLVVGFEAGANDYLTKPISKDELLARIKVHCSQAAIFLENSRLYQDLQASEVRERDRALHLEQSLQLLQQTQLQLVQSEKMASIGQLVAGVAHEINNPLGFITGNLSHAEAFIQDLIRLLELYRQQYPQPAPVIAAQIEAVDLPYLIEDLPQLITSLKTGTDRICEISTSLRIFSRADTTTKVAFNLHEGINSSLMILKHRLKANNRRSKIEVSKEYGDLPLVNCYPGQLNQVFLNLLGNGIDAIDESIQGQSYEAIQTNPKRIIIRTELSQDRQWARIYIKDNGLGMTEAVKQKIFDHLFTTKPVGQGTGLGLSISYQIVVEKHGGQLLCVSSPGEGAEFVIQIPV
ncbi:ATP-binding protein [Cylindrospermum stagnale]